MSKSSSWAEGLNLFLDAKRDAPQGTPEFPHPVHLKDASKTPGSNSLEKLRLVKFFTANKLEGDVDYVIENWYSERQSMTSFIFKDGNMAMLFKLSFQERV